MECTEDEAALRSKVRAIQRVTHVVAFNVSVACQTSINLTASCSINHLPKVLVTVSYKVLTISYKVLTVSYIDYVTDHSVFTVAILA